MEYKLCILAAGIGSRLAPLTDNINKALLPMGPKAALSRIIDKFPVDIAIVIALGFDRENIKEYLLTAHSERNFTFVTVDKITEVGAGPGYSLMCCREYLQTPFVLTTVDTLVEETILSPMKIG